MKEDLDRQYAKLVMNPQRQFAKNSWLEQSFAKFEEKISAITKLPKIIIHNENLREKKSVQKDNSQKKRCLQLHQ